MRAREVFIAVGMLAAAGGLVSSPVLGQMTPDAAAPRTGDLKQRLGQIKDERSTEVKDVPLEDPGTKIRPAPDVTAAARERRLPAPEPREDRPATLPELPAAQRRALFATPGYEQRFAELRRCQDEVALARKAKPADVLAGELELRWTVGADGAVQGATVVAMSPTDPDVLGCVHRRLSSWRIAPPPDTPYRTSHSLKFPGE